MSGGSRGGIRCTQSLILSKKTKIAEGRKAGRASKRKGGRGGVPP